MIINMPDEKNVDTDFDTGYDASADSMPDIEPDLTAGTDTESDAAIRLNINADTDDDDDTDKKSRMELYDWMQCVVTAILCAIFIFVFIGRTIGVEGISMQQTLHWYDRVILSGLFYKPKNGDIVIFRPPTEAFGGTPLVKRVIATAGQTLDINFDTGEVIVDGVVLDEDRYINEPTTNRLNFTGPVTIPEGYVFVMGDNRNHSSDSRDARIGFVDTRYILGKVLFLFIPGDNESSPRDWSRIGFVS